MGIAILPKLLKDRNMLFSEKYYLTLAIHPSQGLFRARQPLSFQVTLEAKGGGFEDESFTVDAAHSAFWGGFRSVTDAQGSAVDYTLGAGSQADWSKSFMPSSVPEPNRFALMTAGLLVVGCMLVYRRQRPVRGGICATH